MQCCKTITLRSKLLKNGMLSFYLDFYPAYRDKLTMKTIRHEFLGIYIYANPKNQRERLFNHSMTEKAEAIRCRRYDSIINERYDFFDKSHQNGDFLEYYRRIKKNKSPKWEFVYAHFVKFVDGRCTFGDVTVELCRKYRDYLLTARNLRNNRPLSKNSVAGYWSTFRGFLNIAFRDKMIKDNVNDYLDKIDYEPVEKSSLTLGELKKLYKTPCDIDILKKASIFSCLTGLRRSDIINLEWKDIRQYANGGWYLDFVSIKTRQQNIIAISDGTLEMIGPKGEGKVFKSFKATMTQYPLKDWLKTAGIKKHITFHSFRHTFASLQLELGTDIYTVQSLLAHKSVTTTQIYARHADPKRREAANRMSFEVLNDVSESKNESSETGTSDE